MLGAAARTVTNMRLKAAHSTAQVEGLGKVPHPIIPQGLTGRDFVHRHGQPADLSYTLERSVIPPIRTGVRQGKGMPQWFNVACLIHRMSAQLQPTIFCRGF